MVWMYAHRAAFLRNKRGDNIHR